MHLSAHSTYLVAAMVWLTSACGGIKAGPPASGNPGAAAATAATAVVLFAVAGGCKLQGCPYGSFCNSVNGLCVAQTCAIGCPSGKVCNEGLNRCQDAPKPRTPTDFLPQDNHTTVGASGTGR